MQRAQVIISSVAGSRFIKIRIDVRDRNITTSLSYVAFSYIERTWREYNLQVSRYICKAVSELA